MEFHYFLIACLGLLLVAVGFTELAAHFQCKRMDSRAAELASEVVGLVPYGVVCDKCESETVLLANIAKQVCTGCGDVKTIAVGKKQGDTK